MARAVVLDTCADRNRRGVGHARREAGIEAGRHAPVDLVRAQVRLLERAADRAGRDWRERVAQRGRRIGPRIRDRRPEFERDGAHAAPRGRLRRGARARYEQCGGRVAVADQVAELAEERVEPLVAEDHERLVALVEQQPVEQHQRRIPAERAVLAERERRHALQPEFVLHAADDRVADPFVERATRDDHVRGARQRAGAELVAQVQRRVGGEVGEAAPGRRDAQRGPAAGREARAFVGRQRAHAARPRKARLRQQQVPVAGVALLRLDRAEHDGGRQHHDAAGQRERTGRGDARRADTGFIERRQGHAAVSSRFGRANASRYCAFSAGRSILPFGLRGNAGSGSTTSGFM